jgi:hypothetical protein
MKKLINKIGLYVAVFLFFAVIWMSVSLTLQSSPADASEEINDPVLEHLELAYEASANHANAMQDATIQAQNNEREAKTLNCLDWKASAYYKLANGIPMVNQMSLTEIDNVNCNAVGF